MSTIELAALRKRAREAGMTQGSVAKAQRLLKEARQARYGVSAQPGLRPPPSPRLIDPIAIDFEGVSRWVVAVCKPSMARGVSEDLPALGFRAYCPLGRRVMLHARGPGGTRRRRIHQWAVFGRYLFVGEMLEPLAAYIHEGIVDVIGDSQGAWPLSPAIVRAINEAELAGEWDFVGSSENPFKIGQSVRIAEGHPFEHFSAVVTALLHGWTRIDLDMFGGATSVSIPTHKLRAALV